MAQLPAARILETGHLSSSLFHILVVRLHGTIRESLPV